MREKSPLEEALGLVQQVQRIKNSRSQERLRKMREQYYPEQMQGRLQSQGLRNQMLQERLEEYPRLSESRMQHMRTMEKIRELSIGQRGASLQAMREKIALAQKNFNLRAQAQQNSMINNGFSFQVQGQPFRKADSTEAKLDIATISAMPEQTKVVQEILKGAHHFIGKPQKFKLYVSGLQNKLTGHSATKAEEKAIAESNISLNAITRAVDSAQRILQFPKTNEGLHTAFGLYTPEKNDSAETFVDRILMQQMDNKNKALKSMHELHVGIPLSPEAENIQQAEIKQAMGSDVWSIPGYKTITSDEVDDFANKHGSDRATAESFLRSKDYHIL